MPVAAAPAPAITTVAFCPQCGTRASGNRFCTQCGTRLADAAAAVISAPSAVKSSSPSPVSHTTAQASRWGAAARTPSPVSSGPTSVVRTPSPQVSSGPSAFALKQQREREEREKREREAREQRERAEREAREAREREEREKREREARDLADRRARENSEREAREKREREEREAREKREREERAAREKREREEREAREKREREERETRDRAAAAASSAEAKAAEEAKAKEERQKRVAAEQERRRLAQEEQQKRLLARTSASTASVTRFGSSPATGSSHLSPSSRSGVRANKTAKRHSKIEMSGGGLGTTEALDVEGLEVTHKKPMSSPRRAPKTKKPAASSPSAGGGGGGSIANRFMASMQAKREAEHKAEREKIRGRRRGGVEFMDTQIRNLITEIKRLSGGTGEGLGEVTYGVLFAKTVESMPALSATLACAKKRGVIKYDGPVMLMQGSSDSVRIVLLRDTIEDSAVFQSVYGQVPAFADEGISSGPKPCHVCTKTVYPSERVAANGKVLHKTCFRCIDCKCTLNLSAYSFNKGKFYCNPHFTRRYQEKLSYDF
eukprot:CAMPEP_0177652920 /NCGR_PEP_ID=MMETSP0447-20121125/13427_1 /TAXON_ID=0 /ORGANISM="Stygamoeba regulata, Strain BSH-02190019" /LENGTH=556 /DNA_ID=CAMNT_0019156277 /DNA_START=166 /DNA_END=1836 /DNA_ORIENTATION=-